ncbi:hypothetical protein [Mesorhizobium amorphae]|uniref:hypothetical protein n=1 Tax=Mesorhizobium amorphae TaxID=71433 RepID=UPI00177FEDD6|nr:hypothetical protein [Mesorhizobium amorphae]
MKTVLIAAVFAVYSLPSMAFDLKGAVETYDEASSICASGENHDGEKVSKAAMKSACADTIRLRADLTGNGYCYDKAKFEWAACK